MTGFFVSCVGWMYTFPERRRQELGYLVIMSRKAATKPRKAREKKSRKVWYYRVQDIIDQIRHYNEYLKIFVFGKKIVNTFIKKSPELNRLAEEWLPQIPWYYQMLNNTLLSTINDGVIKPNWSVTASDATAVVVLVVASCEQSSSFVTNDIVQVVQRDMTVQISHNE